MLARWSGWGALPEVFDDADARHTDVRAELRQVLGEVGYRAARRTTLNAHYTDFALVAEIWRHLGEIGLNKLLEAGPVIALEPGCGSGNFISTAPDGVHVTGVELDQTSADIAQLLNPDAEIRAENFRDTPTPTTLFDLAVGNVPFGDLPMASRDPLLDGMPPHLYFLLDSLKNKMRPGAVGAFIVSRYVLDGDKAVHRRARAAIHESAELVGAVRLPDSAHRAAAGTSVVTDVLVFRRRGRDETPGDASWLETTPVQLAPDAEPITLNTYFLQHPKRVLGTYPANNSARHLKLTHRGDLTADLRRALSEIAAQANERGAVATHREGGPIERPVYPVRETTLPNGYLGIGPTGAFTIVEAGKVKPLTRTRVSSSTGKVTTTPISTTGKTAKELRALITLREAWRELIDAEAATIDDTPHIARLRKALNTRYDAYHREFGPINRYTTSTATISSLAPETLLRKLDASTKDERDPFAENFEKVTGSTLSKVLANAPHTVKITEKTLENGQVTTAQKSSVTLEDAHRALDAALTLARPLPGIDLDELSAELSDRIAAAGAQERRTYAQLGGFRSDPYIEFVLALERFDPVTQTAKKQKIFTKRVAAPRTPPESAENPNDAVAICLDMVGEVRLSVIAELLRIPEERTREALGTAVYDEPGTGRLVPAPLYLGGNVRAKLAAAREAAEADPERYSPNVAALRAVIPADLGPDQIDARLGAVFVPRAVVEQGLRTLLGDPALRVLHVEGEKWEINGDGDNALCKMEYGTERANGMMLAQNLLNVAPILVRDSFKVRDEYTGKYKRVYVTNIPETTAAQDAAMKLNSAFLDWLWSDADRSASICRDFNDRFNNEAPVDWSYFQLTLPGLEHEFKPHRHQLDAVARSLFDHSVGLFHEVGAGKTSEMIMSVMEARRLGLSRLPMVATQKNVLPGFVREWLQRYPQAKLLIANDQFMDKHGLEGLVAAALSEDWDAIITTHDVLARLPLGADAMAEAIDREIERLQSVRDKAVAQDASGQSSTVKDAEANLARAEERALALRLEAPAAVYASFDALGVDALYVDEAHLYKNLRRETPIQDAAIEGAKRATTLRLDLEYLRSLGIDPMVVLATATPIANSVAEAHTMGVYLVPEDMEEQGIADFTDWVATFGEVVPVLELTPDASDYQIKERLAQWRNIQQLSRWFRSFGDVRTAADLDIPGVPTIAGGEPKTIVVPASTAVSEHVGRLSERYKAFKAGHVNEPENNPLAIVHEGRHVALHPRTLGLDDGGEPTKLDAVAENVARIYREHAGDIYPDEADPEQNSTITGSLQLVFCDISTPKPAWNAYDYMRDELEKQGVPRSAIAFIHDAKTDRARAELFAACNDGRIQVLIGSTGKLGMGTNVQRRAVALHDVDVPWRPDYLHQRHGRIQRQGNLNSEVEIYQYVTENTFDAFMWQTVTRKLKFITQFMRGELTDQNSLEEIDSVVALAERTTALATGNPKIIEKHEAEIAVRRLTNLEKTHRVNRTRLQARINTNDLTVRRRTRNLEDFDEFAPILAEGLAAEGFEAEIDGTVHTTHSAARDALRTALRTQMSHTNQGSDRTFIIGNHLGHPVRAKLYGGWNRERNNARVTVQFEHLPDTECPIWYGNLETTDFITQLTNKAKSLIAIREEITDEIEKASTDTATAQGLLAAPFPRAAELTEAREKLSAITKELHGAKVEDGAELETPEEQAASEAEQDAQAIFGGHLVDGIEADHEFIRSGDRVRRTSDRPNASRSNPTRSTTTVTVHVDSAPGPAPAAPSRPGSPSKPVVDAPGAAAAASGTAPVTPAPSAASPARTAPAAAAGAGPARSPHVPAALAGPAALYVSEVIDRAGELLAHTHSNLLSSDPETFGRTERAAVDRVIGLLTSDEHAVAHLRGPGPGFDLESEAVRQALRTAVLERAYDLADRASWAHLDPATVARIDQVISDGLDRKSVRTAGAQPARAVALLDLAALLARDTADLAEQRASIVASVRWHVLAGHTGANIGPWMSQADIDESDKAFIETVAQLMAAEPHWSAICRNPTNSPETVYRVLVENAPQFVAEHLEDDERVQRFLDSPPGLRTYAEHHLPRAVYRLANAPAPGASEDPPAPPAHAILAQDLDPAWLAAADRSSALAQIEREIVAASVFPVDYDALSTALTEILEHAQYPLTVDPHIAEALVETAGWAVRHHLVEPDHAHNRYGTGTVSPAALEAPGQAEQDAAAARTEALRDLLARFDREIAATATAYAPEATEQFRSTFARLLAADPLDTSGAARSSARALEAAIRQDLDVIGASFDLPEIRTFANRLLPLVVAQARYLNQELQPRRLRQLIADQPSARVRAIVPSPLELIAENLDADWLAAADRTETLTAIGAETARLTRKQDWTTNAVNLQDLRSSYYRALLSGADGMKSEMAGQSANRLIEALPWLITHGVIAAEHAPDRLAPGTLNASALETPGEEQRQRAAARIERLRDLLAEFDRDHQAAAHALEPEDTEAARAAWTTLLESVPTALDASAVLAGRTAMEACRSLSITLARPVRRTSDLLDEKVIPLIKEHRAYLRDELYPARLAQSSTHAAPVAKDASAPAQEQQAGADQRAELGRALAQIAGGAERIEALHRQHTDFLQRLDGPAAGWLYAQNTGKRTNDGGTANEQLRQRIGDSLEEFTTAGGIGATISDRPVDTDLGTMLGQPITLVLEPLDGNRYAGSLRWGRYPAWIDLPAGTPRIDGSEPTIGPWQPDLLDMPVSGLAHLPAHLANLINNSVDEIAELARQALAAGASPDQITRAGRGLVAVTDGRDVHVVLQAAAELPTVEPIAPPTPPAPAVEPAAPLPKPQVTIDHSAQDTIVTLDPAMKRNPALERTLTRADFTFNKRQNAWIIYKKDRRTGAFRTPADRTRSVKQLTDFLDSETIAWRDARRPSHPPTVEQQAVLDAAGAGLAGKGTTDIAVTAVAGAGKTSTLLMLADAVSTALPEARVLYLAYNKSAAAEAKEKFPANTEVRTIHAYAYHALSADPDTAAYLTRRMPANDNDTKGTPYQPPNEKARLLGITNKHHISATRSLDPGQLAELALRAVERFCQSAAEKVGPQHVALDQLNIDDPVAEDVLREVVAGYARRAWTDLNDREAGRLQLNPDAYLKAWALSNPVVPHEVVLLDEAQDSNELTAALLRGQRAKLTVIVGDAAQQLYRWRGATDILSTWQARDGDLKRLTLTQSFRFGETIATEANKWLSLLENYDTRVSGNPALDSEITYVEGPAAILCRTNAGAIEALIGELDNGRRVAVAGGTGELKSLCRAAADIKAGRGTTNPALMAFARWEDVVEHAETDAGADLRRYVFLIDRKGPDALLEMISQTVGEAEEPDVVISTAHKSKGLEFSSVRIHSDFKFVDQDGAPRIPTYEEVMLSYVAVTRAKNAIDLGPLTVIDELTPGAPANLLAAARAANPSVEQNHAEHRPTLLTEPAPAAGPVAGSAPGLSRSPVPADGDRPGPPDLEPARRAALSATTRLGLGPHEAATDTLTGILDQLLADADLRVLAGTDDGKFVQAATDALGTAISDAFELPGGQDLALGYEPEIGTELVGFLRTAFNTAAAQTAAETGRPSTPNLPSPSEAPAPAARRPAAAASARPVETQRRRRGHRFYPTAAELAEIPDMRATEKGNPAEATVHLHYFLGGMDWYVTELAHKGERAGVDGFGWILRHGDQAELGYIDLEELERLNVTAQSGLPIPLVIERDLYFDKAPAHEVVEGIPGRWISKLDAARNQQDNAQADAPQEDPAAEPDRAPEQADRQDPPGITAIVIDPTKPLPGPVAAAMAAYQAPAAQSAAPVDESGFPPLHLVFATTGGKSGKGELRVEGSTQPDKALHKILKDAKLGYSKPTLEDPRSFWYAPSTWNVETKTRRARQVIDALARAGRAFTVETGGTDTPKLRYLSGPPVHGIESAPARTVPVVDDYRYPESPTGQVFQFHRDGTEVAVAWGADETPGAGHLTGTAAGRDMYSNLQLVHLADGRLLALDPRVVQRADSAILPTPRPADPDPVTGEIAPGIRADGRGLDDEAFTRAHPNLSEPTRHQHDVAEQLVLGALHTHPDQVQRFAPLLRGHDFRTFTHREAALALLARAEGATLTTQQQARLSDRLITEWAAMAQANDVDPAAAAGAVASVDYLAQRQDQVRAAVLETRLAQWIGARQAAGHEFTDEQATALAEAPVDLARNPEMTAERWRTDLRGFGEDFRVAVLRAFGSDAASEVIPDLIAYLQNPGPGEQAHRTPRGGDGPAAEQVDMQADAERHTVAPHLVIGAGGRELAALAGAIGHPERVEQLAAILEENIYDLDGPHHRAAFRIMLERHRAGEPIDLPGLAAATDAHLRASMSGHGASWYRELVAEQLPRWLEYLATLPAAAGEQIFTAAASMVGDRSLAGEGAKFANTPLYDLHRPFTGQHVDPAEARYLVLAAAGDPAYTGLLAATLAPEDFADPDLAEAFTAACTGQPWSDLPSPIAEHVHAWAGWVEAQRHRGPIVHDAIGEAATSVLLRGPRGLAHSVPEGPYAVQAPTLAEPPAPAAVVEPYPDRASYRAGQDRVERAAFRWTTARTAGDDDAHEAELAPVIEAARFVDVTVAERRERGAKSAISVREASGFEHLARQASRALEGPVGHSPQAPILRELASAAAAHAASLQASLADPALAAALSRTPEPSYDPAHLIDDQMSYGLALRTRPEAAPQQARVMGPEQARTFLAGLAPDGIETREGRFAFTTDDRLRQHLLPLSAKQAPAWLAEHATAPEQPAQVNAPQSAPAAGPAPAEEQDLRPAPAAGTIAPHLVIFEAVREYAALAAVTYRPDLFDQLESALGPEAEQVIDTAVKTAYRHLAQRHRAGRSTDLAALNAHDDTSETHSPARRREKAGYRELLDTTLPQYHAYFATLSPDEVARILQAAIAHIATASGDGSWYDNAPVYNVSATTRFTGRVVDPAEAEHMLVAAAQGAHGATRLLAATLEPGDFSDPRLGAAFAAACAGQAPAELPAAAAERVEAWRRWLAEQRADRAMAQGAIREAATSVLLCGPRGFAHPASEGPYQIATPVPITPDPTAVAAPRPLPQSAQATGLVTVHRSVPDWLALAGAPDGEQIHDDILGQHRLIDGIAVMDWQRAARYVPGYIEPKLLTAMRHNAEATVLAAVHAEPAAAPLTAELLDTDSDLLLADPVHRALLKAAADAQPAASQDILQAWDAIPDARKALSRITHEATTLRTPPIEQAVTDLARLAHAERVLRAGNAWMAREIRARNLDAEDAAVLNDVVVAAATYPASVLDLARLIDPIRFVDPGQSVIDINLPRAQALGALNTAVRTAAGSDELPFALLRGVFDQGFADLPEGGQVRIVRPSGQYVPLLPADTAARYQQMRAIPAAATQRAIEQAGPSALALEPVALAVPGFHLAVGVDGERGQVTGPDGQNIGSVGKTRTGWIGIAEGDKAPVRRDPVAAAEDAARLWAFANAVQVTPGHGTAFTTSHQAHTALGELVAAVAVVEVAGARAFLLDYGKQPEARTLMKLGEDLEKVMRPRSAQQTAEVAERLTAFLEPAASLRSRLVGDQREWLSYPLMRIAQIIEDLQPRLQATADLLNARPQREVSDAARLGGAETMGAAAAQAVGLPAGDGITTLLLGEHGPQIGSVTRDAIDRWTVRSEADPKWSETFATESGAKAALVIRHTREPQPEPADAHTAAPAPQPENQAVERAPHYLLLDRNDREIAALAVLLHNPELVRKFIAAVPLDRCGFAPHHRAAYRRIIESTSLGTEASIDALAAASDDEIAREIPNPRWTRLYRTTTDETLPRWLGHLATLEPHVPGQILHAAIGHIAEAKPKKETKPGKIEPGRYHLRALHSPTRGFGPDHRVHPDDAPFALIAGVRVMPGLAERLRASLNPGDFPSPEMAAAFAEATRRRERASADPDTADEPADTDDSDDQAPRPAPPSADADAWDRIVPSEPPVEIEAAVTAWLQRFTDHRPIRLEEVIAEAATWTVLAGPRGVPWPTPDQPVDLDPARPKAAPSRSAPGADAAPDRTAASRAGTPAPEGAVAQQERLVLAALLRDPTTLLKLDALAWTQNPGEMFHGAHRAIFHMFKQRNDQGRLSSDALHNYSDKRMRPHIDAIRIMSHKPASPIADLVNELRALNGLPPQDEQAAEGQTSLDQYLAPDTAEPAPLARMSPAAPRPTEARTRPAQRAAAPAPSAQLTFDDLLPTGSEPQPNAAETAPFAPATQAGAEPEAAAEKAPSPPPPATALQEALDIELPAPVAAPAATPEEDSVMTAIADAPSPFVVATDPPPDLVEAFAKVWHDSHLSLHAPTSSAATNLLDAWKSVDSSHFEQSAPEQRREILQQLSNAARAIAAALPAEDSDQELLEPLAAIAAGFAYSAVRPLDPRPSAPGEGPEDLNLDQDEDHEQDEAFDGEDEIDQMPEAAAHIGPRAQERAEAEPEDDDLDQQAAPVDVVDNTANNEQAESQTDLFDLMEQDEADAEAAGAAAQNRAAAQKPNAQKPATPRALPEPAASQRSESDAGDLEIRAPGEEARMTDTVTPTPAPEPGEAEAAPQRPATRPAPAAPAEMADSVRPAPTARPSTSVPQPAAPALTTSENVVADAYTAWLSTDTAQRLPVGHPQAAALDAAITTLNRVEPADLGEAIKVASRRAEELMDEIPDTAAKADIQSLGALMTTLWQLEPAPSPAEPVIEPAPIPPMEEHRQASAATPAQANQQTDTDDAFNKIVSGYDEPGTESPPDALRRLLRSWHRGLSSEQLEQSPNLTLADAADAYLAQLTPQSQVTFLGDPSRTLLIRLDEARRAERDPNTRVTLAEIRRRVKAIAPPPRLPIDRSDHNEVLREIHRDAARQLRSNLYAPNSARARKYLIDRGFRWLLEPGNVFAVGYNPRGSLEGMSLHQTLTIRGHSIEDLLEAGVVAQGKDGPYDRFYDRIVFPITDADGATIAFAGRALSEDAKSKYINSPETPIYHKGQVVYGLGAQRGQMTEESVLVPVEGYLDAAAVTLAGGGVFFGVAAGGTALTDGHLAQLDRGPVGRVFGFDNDPGGRRATVKAHDLLLERDGSIADRDSVFVWPVKDPAELIEQGRTSELTEVLHGSRVAMGLRRVQIELDQLLGGDESPAARRNAAREEIPSALRVLERTPELAELITHALKTRLDVGGQNLVDDVIAQVRSPQTGAATAEDEQARFALADSLAAFEDVVGEKEPMLKRDLKNLVSDLLARGSSPSLVSVLGRLRALRADQIAHEAEAAIDAIEMLGKNIRRVAELPRVPIAEQPKNPQPSQSSPSTAPAPTATATATARPGTEPEQVARALAPIRTLAPGGPAAAAVAALRAATVELGRLTASNEVTGERAARLLRVEVDRLGLPQDAANTAIADGLTEGRRAAAQRPQDSKTSNNGKDATRPKLLEAAEQPAAPGNDQDEPTTPASRPIGSWSLGGGTAPEKPEAQPLDDQRSPLEVAAHRMYERVHNSSRSRMRHVVGELATDIGHEHAAGQLTAPEVRALRGWIRKNTGLRSQDAARLFDHGIADGIERYERVTGPRVTRRPNQAPKAANTIELAKAWKAAIAQAASDYGPEASAALTALVSTITDHFGTNIHQALNAGRSTSTDADLSADLKTLVNALSHKAEAGSDPAVKAAAEIAKSTRSLWSRLDPTPSVRWFATHALRTVSNLLARCAEQNSRESRLYARLAARAATWAERVATWRRPASPQIQGDPVASARSGGYRSLAEINYRLGQLDESTRKWAATPTMAQVAADDALARLQRKLFGVAPLRETKELFTPRNLTEQSAWFSEAATAARTLDQKLTERHGPKFAGRDPLKEMIYRTEAISAGMKATARAQISGESGGKAAAAAAAPDKPARRAVRASRTYRHPALARTRPSSSANSSPGPAAAHHR